MPEAIYQQHPCPAIAEFRVQREMRGISCRALARLVGISGPYLSDLERGSRGRGGISESLKARITAALEKWDKESKLPIPPAVTGPGRD